MDPTLASAGITAGVKFVGDSIDVIRDKIRLAKEKGNYEEAIQSLEEIINGLINDKLELTNINQKYNEELIIQKLSEDDIQYISESFIPVMEEFSEKFGGKDKEKFQETIEIIKPLVSKEILNVMQLMGFNFKRAIGEPLTEMVSNNLTANAMPAPDIQKLIEQRQLEFFKMINDPESFERYAIIQEANGSPLK